jgi:uncharacterized SAM-binding protein YcdF (DUF218 family)
MSRLDTGILADANAEKGGIISKLIFLIFFVFVFAILYFARHPLLRAAGNFWTVDQTPEVSDAIVILTGDNYDADRAARAATLYKSGMAPRVVATGKALRSYASSTDLMKRDLVERGVPAKSIDEFTHREDDTRDEAIALTEFIATHKWRKILLVTSNYQTRRAEYIFERTLAQGSQLRVISAPDSEYDPNNWWHSGRGLKIFFHEAVGSLVAIWELRHYDVQTS